MQDVLQLSLFTPPEQKHTNIVALYDLAPKFVQRTERDGKQAYLSRLTREFTFNNELYTVTVSPTRITGSKGEEWEELPGDREALVEDVLRRLAADKMDLSENEELTMSFSLYAIYHELKRHNHTLSYAEIKEALLILNGSKIEISKVVLPGEKKPKPVVYASALPVLFYKDDNNPEALSYVQFNPLIVQAIKTLEFEQLDYEWMMNIKGQVPRWIFKFASLALSEGDGIGSSIELHASELVRSLGHTRSRERDALADIEKAIKRLKDSGVIADFKGSGVMNGKVKADIRFLIRFSEKFMQDRQSARLMASHRRGEAKRITGSARPESFHKLSANDAAEVRMKQRKLIAAEAS